MIYRIKFTESEKGWKKSVHAIPATGGKKYHLSFNEKMRRYKVINANTGKLEKDSTYPSNVPVPTRLLRKILIRDFGAILGSKAVVRIDIPIAKRNKNSLGKFLSTSHVNSSRRELLNLVKEYKEKLKAKRAELHLVAKREKLEKRLLKIQKAIDSVAA